MNASILAKGLAMLRRRFGSSAAQPPSRPAAQRTRWFRSSAAQPPSRPAAQHPKGFTFLELLVALAILGSSFLVLLTAHTSAMRQEGRARRLMTATLLARQVLAETEVDGFPELGGDSGDFGEEFPNYTWERTVLTTPFDLAREVHVQISWPEPGTTETLDVVFFAVEEPS